MAITANEEACGDYLRVGLVWALGEVWVGELRATVVRRRLDAVLLDLRACCACLSARCVCILTKRHVQALLPKELLIADLLQTNMMKSTFKYVYVLMYTYTLTYAYMHMFAVETFIVESLSCYSSVRYASLRLFDQHKNINVKNMHTNAHK